jgi:hypothetical protein
LREEKKRLYLVAEFEPRFFTAEIAEIAESDATGSSFTQAGEKAFRL